MKYDRSSCYGSLRFAGDDLRVHIGLTPVDHLPYVRLASSYGGYADIEIDGLTIEDAEQIKTILEGALKRGAAPVRVLEAAE